MGGSPRRRLKNSGQPPKSTTELCDFLTYFMGTYDGNQWHLKNIYWYRCFSLKCNIFTLHALLLIKKHLVLSLLQWNSNPLCYIFACHSQKWRWIQVCFTGSSHSTGHCWNGEWLLVKFPANKVQFSLNLLSNCICGEFQYMLTHCKSAICLFKKWNTRLYDEEFKKKNSVNIQGDMWKTYEGTEPPSLCRTILGLAGGLAWLPSSQWLSSLEPLEMTPPTSHRRQYYL